MLARDQVNQDERDGYKLREHFLTTTELSALLSEVSRISSGNTLGSHDRTRLEMEPGQAQEGMLVRRIYEPCTHYKLFQELSNSTKLLDCMEQLLGPDLMFHYSKINMKPPEIG